MLKILIIDDSSLKSDDIKRMLEERCECEIAQAYARNTGLIAVMNAKKNDSDFDIIMCDNYMPIYEGERDIRPLGKHIIREIKERIDSSAYICMCSSEDIEECGYDWLIKYDYSVYLGDDYDRMLEDYISNHPEHENDIK